MPSACAGLILRGPNKGQAATGTEAGYSRHMKAGESACRPCLDAKAEAVDRRRPYVSRRVPVEQSCRQCSRTYLTSGAVNASPFCARECQKRSVGHTGDRSPRACLWCEAVFAPRRSFSKYCSLKCAERSASSVYETLAAQQDGERRRANRVSYRRFQKAYADLLADIQKLNRRCGWCDDPIGRLHLARKYCSESCMRFDSGHRATSSPIYVKVCAICPKVFTARRASALYCSKGCVREGRSQDRIGARRNDIFERDGWICKLCDSPVDLTDFRTVPGADGREAFVAGPLYPSVDHIVPQSLGGSHEDHNLRTAHFGCNSERGAGTEDEQLAWAV
jgi:5-methylcytosine-specific restriction endonuclease McrA